MRRGTRLTRWTVSAGMGLAMAIGLAVPAQAATSADAPSYVRIDGRCGGALIDPEWVITVKDCAPAGDATRLALTAGWSGAEQARSVSLHGLVSQHAPTGDVALVRVAPVTGVPVVPLSSRLLADGDVFRVSLGAQGRLSQADFEVDSPAYPYDYLARSRSGAAICDGDRGGPAVVRTATGDQLVGLVRFGYAPCAPFGTAAFSKLGAEATATWVAQTMAQLDRAGAYAIVNKNSGKALDVNAAGEVVQSTRVGSPRQTWTLADDHRKTPDPHASPVTVTNAASGRLLGVVGGATGDGARAVEFPDVGVADQSWSILPAGGGYYTIVNNNSGKVLGIPAGSQAEGENAVQWTSLGVDDQLWRVTRVG